MSRRQRWEQTTLGFGLVGAVNARAAEANRAAREVVGMVRHGGRETSIAAAHAALNLNRIHRDIIRAFREREEFELRQNGPRGYTDGELETLVRFMSYGPSTIRKRRSELTLDPRPYLQPSGQLRANPRARRESMMIVWELTDRGRTVDP